VAAGRGLRAVLGLELVLAVLPVTLHYIGLFPGARSSVCARTTPPLTT
jgi:hypothetical protein